MKYNLLKESLVTMSKAKDFYCFDTETTGLSPTTNRMIQISIIHGQFVENKIKEVDRLSLYIHPGDDFLPLPKKIVELTNITTEKIKADGIPEEEAYKQIKNFMGEHPCITGWNVNFDYKFLNALYARQLDSFDPETVVDSLKIAKQVIPKSEVENYKLITISDYLHLSDSVSFHNAEDDTYVTYLIFQILYEEIMAKQEDMQHGTIKPIITKIQFWTKSYSKSNFMKRIYIMTNYGTMYLDLYTDEFQAKDSMDLSAIDMKYVKSFLYWATRTNAQTIHDFKGTITFK